jgi:hypothetical protein
VHSILKNNTNIIDVEVALSRSAEIETDHDDESTNGRPIADRIDFAALQRKGKGDEAHISYSLKQSGSRTTSCARRLSRESLSRLENTKRSSRNIGRRLSSPIVGFVKTSLNWCRTAAIRWSLG